MEILISLKNASQIKQPGIIPIPLPQNKNLGSNKYVLVSCTIIFYQWKRYQN